jgi:hypothetical protein
MRIPAARGLSFIIEFSSLFQTPFTPSGIKALHPDILASEEN